MIPQEKLIFIRSLYHASIIQFGEFKLKSGQVSPFYIDMRKLVAFPELMLALSQLIRQDLGEVPPETLICGVPYGAIPVAVSFALEQKVPLLLLRKERKQYGKKNQLEGVWNEGQSVILMEDVITTGESIWESIHVLQEEHLRIHTVIVFVDREQGGFQRLTKAGYSVKSILKITEIVEALKEELTPEKINTIHDFIRQKPVETPAPITITPAPHPLSKTLLQLAQIKKSNLILSADVETTQELWHLIRSCASHIVALKLHADIIRDFTLDFAKSLRVFAQANQFLIIEDRKLADIGHTQYLQSSQGLHQIAQWADMVTVHFIAGASSIVALGKQSSLGLIGIVEMSSEGALTDENYIQQSLQIMQDLSPLFVGAVCQKANLPVPFLKFSPGIHLASTGDGQGQQYQDPAKAIAQQQTDLIIVGRGIYASDNPKASSEKYQTLGWKAFEQRLSPSSITSSL